MRYPVVDDFAVDLSLGFFRAMWERDLSLPVALGQAVADSAPEEPTPGAPALSAFTPTLLAPKGEPTLRAPLGAPSPPNLKMAGFDPEPGRFVGRVGAITRANAALAPRSPQRGVLFFGMAGAGKTTCALEVAYGQEANFTKLVWHRCPEEGADGPAVAASLRDLAAKLEEATTVFFVDAVDQPERLGTVLARLSEALEQRSVLVVLDNIESLLVESGAWSDPRWGEVVRALCAHDGPSRLVLTSRRAPRDLPPRVTGEAVHALSAGEAVLLARRLPNLAALLNGAPAGTRGGPEVLRSVLGATGGHPKLLELADAAVADPALLEQMTAGATAAWAGAGVDPTAFLSGGEPTQGQETVETYINLLHNWAARAIATLDESQVLLLQLLCRADDPDRIEAVLEANWADLWHRLERPDPVPDHVALLQRLVEAALIERSGADPRDLLIVHPAVAETVAEGTDDAVAAAADHELAAFWLAMFGASRTPGEAGGEQGDVLLRAAHQAVVYLVRLEEWRPAQALVEEVLLRDGSPATAAGVIGVLRHIAEASEGTDVALLARSVLAKALARVDPDEGERLMRQVEADTVAAGRYPEASAIAGDLANLLKNTGRLHEALEVIERKLGHTKAAGLGPWTQLADRGRGHQIRLAMGDAEAVLSEAEAMLEEADGYPDPGGDEAVTKWGVLEPTLGIARQAALDLEHFEASLRFLDRTLASKRARGATDYELASTSFNAYAPLLRLGRIDEAREVLVKCRTVAEAEGDYGFVGQCLSAQANLEDEEGFADQAIELERRALRFTYLQPNPVDIGGSHNNLAIYLTRSSGDQEGAIAHRLADVVLSRIVGSGGYKRKLLELGRQLTAGAVPPARFDELCAVVERVEGVRFQALVGALGADGDEQLTLVLEEARALPPELVYEEHLSRWEPVFVLLVAARGGHLAARARLDAALAERALQSEWAELADCLGRLRDGEDDLETLSAGLDPIDTAIVTRALEACAGRVALDPAPESLQPLLEAVVEIATLAGAVQKALRKLDVTEGWSALAAQLRRVLEGDEVVWDGLDTVDTAILVSVLSKVGALASEPDP
jgi:tetratricopeptide (TPR) repeat protein